MLGSRRDTGRLVDRHGASRPALGPGAVTHWVVAALHVSGLGPVLSGGSGRIQFPRVSGARLRLGGVAGEVETDRDRSAGRGGPRLGGGSDLLQPPVRVWRGRSGGGRDPELGWARPGKGQES